MYRFLLIALSFLITCCQPTVSGQTPRQRAVELSALVQESPAKINLSWRQDDQASQYTVYRKALEDTSWGDPIAILPGNATSYSDINVEVGVGYEYAFYKADFEPARDTFCIPPGTTLNFSINSQFGEGLCCSFGFGYYQISSCGTVNIEGADYGFGESNNFTICQSSEACEEVILEIQADIFPHLNSWSLANVGTGEVIASSGPQGTLIDERPSFGYIYSGIKIPPLESRGTILLMIEDSLEGELEMELDRLEMDMIKDGWQVMRQYVNRELPVPEVKAIIKNVKDQVSGLSALFLIGHIPVPYSGDIYPDTHTEHRGAWAADVYYAEHDALWTDDTVNRTTAFFAYNHNVPGDGKFDQSYLLDDVDLQMGRLDFFNMPAFSESEVELYKRYLNKNHAFRNRLFTVRKMALIDDNFGQAFASPAAGAWRNFATMFGYENVQELDYFSTMRDNSYLFSFGCGSGSHISSAGIGTTQDFANDSLQTVFTLLFGSQFGDWDNVNNFLRAPLASGMTLTNAWSGSNPPWTLHHMSMGFPIGFSAMKTQNSNNGVYIPGPQLVHVALLGDPTLRLHPAKSPEDLTIINSEEGPILSWTMPDDEIMEAFHIYRSDTITGKFSRINEAPITETSYVDNRPLYGKNVYIVRGLKLEESASGTYYNLSPGIIESTESFIITDTTEPPEIDWNISPNPGKDHLNLQINNPGSGKFFFQLFNNLGQKVLSMQINTANTAINEQIDVSFLNSGTFFAVINSRDFTVSKKIILR